MAAHTLTLVQVSLTGLGSNLNLATINPVILLKFWSHLYLHKICFFDEESYLLYLSSLPWEQ